MIGTTSLRGRCGITRLRQQNDIAMAKPARTDQAIPASPRGHARMPRGKKGRLSSEAGKTAASDTQEIRNGQRKGACGNARAHMEAAPAAMTQVGGEKPERIMTSQMERRCKNSQSP